MRTCTYTCACACACGLYRASSSRHAHPHTLSHQVLFERRAAPIRKTTLVEGCAVLSGGLARCIQASLRGTEAGGELIALHGQHRLNAFSVAAREHPLALHVSGCAGALRGPLKPWLDHIAFVHVMMPCLQPSDGLPYDAELTSSRRGIRHVGWRCDAREHDRKRKGGHSCCCAHRTGLRLARLTHPTARGVCFWENIAIKVMHACT